jgi:uncharacterized protein HemY
MEKGNCDHARQLLQDGVNMPKSYGEAKTFFNQEAHIYYYLGKLYLQQGDGEKAQQAYRQAAVYKAAVSEISLFRALALQELGDMDSARQVLEEILRTVRMPKLR